MLEVLCILAILAAAGIFWCYRKDQAKLVDLYRTDHLQHFSAMLSHCEWMTRMTEQGVEKVQELSGQVVSQSFPPSAASPGDLPADWSLQKEWEAEQERAKQQAAVEGNGGGAASEPAAERSREESLRSLFEDLGIRPPTAEEMTSE